MRSKFLSDSQIEIIKHHMSTEHWTPFAVMLDTGLRVGDVVSLKWVNILRDTFPWRICTIAEKTGKPIVCDIKASTVRLLSSSEVEHCDSEYVFPSPKDAGKHISRVTVWRRLKRALMDVGISLEGFSPHSFRKHFAVDKLHSDGIEAVRMALQHTNTSTTRIYAYSDTVMSRDSDEPIRWRDLELLTDYIVDIVMENVKNIDIKSGKCQ